MQNKYYIRKDLVIINQEFVSEQSLLDALDFHLMKNSYLTSIMFKKPVEDINKKSYTKKTFSQVDQFERKESVNIFIVEEGTNRLISRTNQEDLISSTK